MARRKEILHSVKHFLIGSALTLKGADKIGHHPVIGSIILLFGLIILVYFFYLLIKKHPNEKLAPIVHWFEAIASLFTAYIFFEEGATYLPWVFLLASFGFFLSIYIEHRHKKHPEPQAQQEAP
jgi:TRAP-type uncharacterized transport system fused permease subunit